jgi:proliferating cell nuclear antigen
MGNSDTLTLYIDKDDESTLGIKIENSEKNSITKYKLNLMDLHEDNISIPPAVFDSVITMPSVDFQKICRDMHNLSDNIEIRSLENQIIFSCKGHFASQETIIGETNSGLSFVKNQNPEEIVQGIFALKHLILFSKCTNLCSSIELYLKNDYPLIIKYAVASLGEIKLCLAPKCDIE